MWDWRGFLDARNRFGTDKEIPQKFWVNFIAFL